MVPPVRRNEDKSFQMPSLSYYSLEMGRDQINDIRIVDHPSTFFHSCLPHSGLGQAAGLFDLTSLQLITFMLCESVLY